MSASRKKLVHRHVPQFQNLVAQRESLSAAESASSPYAHRLNSLVQEWWGDWKQILTQGKLSTDLLAGLTVAAVALPLNVALAIAAGLPPSAGIIAGAVGGAIAAIFGGTRLQVTGPAAALNTMVFVIVQQYGAVGAAAAALAVGVMQILLCLAFAGKLVRFVPEAVLAGFTTGVGIKLLDGQIPLLLGVDHPVSFLLGNLHSPTWLHDVSWHAVVCGFLMIFVMIAGKPWKRFPAALMGITLATLLSTYVGWDLQRVGEVPSQIPDLALPELALSQWLDLLIKCLPLGILAAAESLLSAQALDRMKPESKPHNSNLELFGQGVANIGVSLFAGMPVTGVVVRSSVNVQSGGKTRVASITHALILFASVMFIGGILGKVPVAALAGLLCMVGYRLVEVSHFWHLLKTHRAEAAAFLAAAVGTVTGHLMLGLGSGLAIYFAAQWLSRGKRARSEVKKDQHANGIRAVVASQETEARRPAPYQVQSKGEQWGHHLAQQAWVPRSAYVHPNASVIGRVVLGERVHIAAEASVRADEGTPFYIGDETNIQDGVVIHALKGKHVQVGLEKWAVYVGKSVSMAHQALIHGPCFIGDRTFIGFKSVIHDSVIGTHCYVGIGAVVVGVEVPDGRYVPHGSVIDSQEKVSLLPPVTEHHLDFNEDVVEVNVGLAEAYHAQGTPEVVTENVLWEPSVRSRSVPVF